MKHTELSIALVIDVPTVYTDTTLATASWWDRYTLHPGAYVVEWDVDTNVGTPFPRIDTGRVKVAATLEERYRENRIFAEVQGIHETPGTEAFVWLSTYPWNWMRAAAVTDRSSTAKSLWGGKVEYVPSLEVRRLHRERRQAWLKSTGQTEWYTGPMTAGPLA